MDTPVAVTVLEGVAVVSVNWANLCLNNLNIVKEELPRDFLLTRPFSNQDKLDVTDSLMEVKDSPIKSNSVFDDISFHGFSEQLVQDVVANCHHPFIVNDILELCPTFSIVHALKVLELIQEPFLNIPNFDEFLDIMRFEEWCASVDLSHLLRGITLLGDSPESTYGEDEEIVEVL